MDTNMTFGTTDDGDSFASWTNDDGSQTWTTTSGPAAGHGFTRHTDGTTTFH